MAADRSVIYSLAAPNSVGLYQIAVTVPTASQLVMLPWL